MALLNRHLVMTSTRPGMCLLIPDLLTLIPDCSNVVRISVSMRTLDFTAFAILPIAFSDKTMGGGTLGLISLAISVRQSLIASLTLSIRVLQIGWDKGSELSPPAEVLVLTVGCGISV